MSRAAFHSALHVFGSHSHWESGGRGGVFKISFYKQMTRRRWSLIFRNGSMEINTHQKELQRNKEETERAKDRDREGLT